MVLTVESEDVPWQKRLVAEAERRRGCSTLEDGSLLVRYLSQCSND